MKQGEASLGETPGVGETDLGRGDHLGEFDVGAVSYTHLTLPTT